MIKFIIVVLSTMAFIISVIFGNDARIVNDALRVPWWHFAGLFVFGFLVTILCALLLFGSNKANWENIAWHANPFNRKQPLQFFHLFSWVLILSGLSLLIIDAIQTNLYNRDALFILVMGLGVRVGMLLIAPRCTIECR